MIILEKEIEIFSKLSSFQYIENLNTLSAKSDQLILDHLEDVISKNRNPWQIEIYSELLSAWKIGWKGEVKQLLAMRKSQHQLYQCTYMDFKKQLDEELQKRRLVQGESIAINECVGKRYIKHQNECGRI